ncbi:hypothetical protein [Allokutzneria oryzae]|uniref:Secreted protein n=1 Tax=Allokutzneria oryzae TaxID=1378989 RepID=A0ABV5ZR62_9PSEU
MKILKVTTAAAAVLGLFLVGSPASAATKLGCVKVWDKDDTIGATAHATNNCAKSVKLKFVINNDFDSGWRTVRKGEGTSYGHGPFSNLDKVLIQYDGKDYVNRP